MPVSEKYDPQVKLKCFQMLPRSSSRRQLLCLIGCGLLMNFDYDSPGGAQCLSLS